MQWVLFDLNEIMSRNVVLSNIVAILCGRSLLVWHYWSADFVTNSVALRRMNNNNNERLDFLLDDIRIASATVRMNSCVLNISVRSAYDRVDMYLEQEIVSTRRKTTREQIKWTRSLIKERIKTRTWNNCVLFACKHRITITYFKQWFSTNWEREQRINVHWNDCLVWNEC
jgi:hypothetical protein